MPVTEEEALAEFQKTLSELEERVVTKTVRTLLQKTAAGPGGNRWSPASALATTSAQPLLGGDQKFRDWLTSPRGKSSSYAASFADFHIEKKASPLLNVGGVMHVPGVAGAPPIGLRLVELLPVIPLPAGSSVEFAKESGFAPGGDVVIEGAIKPTSAVDITNALAAIKTIATVTRASVQSLSDCPGLLQWLDARLLYAVQLKAEDWLLNGVLPDGLLANATALSPAFTPPAAATIFDVVASALAQLLSLGFQPDGIVLSAADALGARLVKSTTGEFLWAGPDASVGVTSLFGTQVVVSPSMAPGQFLVGAFSQAAALFSRQQLIVEISFEDQDNFVRNLATIRAEERLGIGVAVPSGLVKGSLSVAPGMKASPPPATK